MTQVTALAKPDAFIEFTNMPSNHKWISCEITEYFGKSCKECWIKKYNPTQCCDGPCEICTFEDCPHCGGRRTLYA
jgi:hypothetical protein